LKVANKLHAAVKNNNLIGVQIAAKSMLNIKRKKKKKYSPEVAYHTLVSTTG